MARKPVRRKPRPKKRSWTRIKSSPGEHRHWLGEELYSEEALRLELDPVLYAVDNELHRLVNSAAHSYDGNEKRPLAIFMPIPETIGWQSVYIAKVYNTYLLSDAETEGINEASDFFKIKPLDFDGFDKVDYWVDLFVSTSYLWNSADEFHKFMNDNLGLLSPEGRAYAVLIGSAPLSLADDNEIEIQWFDGTYSNLADIQAFRWFDGVKPVVARTICLPALNPSDPARLSTFAKRNKKFFVDDVQVILNKLLDGESGFRDQFELPAAGQQVPWAVILSWKSPAKY